MKKIIITIILLFSITNISYAGNDCSWCKIKDAPAEALQEYIENQRTIISRITNAAAWERDTMNLDVLEQKFNEINSIIDFDSYYSDFEYILLELFTSVPREIKRDKIKIENELTYLQNYIERSIKRKYSWVSVTSDEICDDIENCNLSWSVLSVLTKLAENNSNILSLYKNSILWQNTVKEDFIIVPDTFYDDLIDSYNKNTLMSCSSCEWWYFNELKVKIKKISENMKSTWKSTKYWKDAWNLLTWKVTDAELKKLEKDLLTKELSRQWLTKSQSQIILNNLDKFYDSTWWAWFSTENNFISNSIASITYALWKYINTFNDVIAYIKEEYIDDWIVITHITKEIAKKDATQEMYLDMQKVYASLVKEASMQSIVDEKSINKLISIHTSLSKLISNLEKTIEPAQNVCKDQCAWVWNCSDY